MGLNKTYTMKQSIQYGIVWLLGIALMSPLFGWSQGLVTGTVSDENRMPIPGATASGTDKEKIAKQFWIAMYNRGFEGWTVYRLYDARTLKNSGTLDLPVPKRYTYPQSEQTINGENIKAANGGNDTQQTSIFWG